MYKFLINYIRLELLRLVLNRFMANKAAKGKTNLKSMSIMGYLVEILISYMLAKRKVGKAK